MSHLRPAVIGLQVIATLAAMEALGSLAAASYENSELAQARSAVEKAHHSFGARVATALADGTDRPLLAPIIAEETRLHSAPAVAPTYFVDTLPLQSLQQRARKLRTLSG